MGIGALLLNDPEIAVRQAEILADVPFSDRSLDTLRHELLNLAASGFRLENQGLEDHLVAKGLAGLVARLRVSGGPSPDETSSGDVDAEFLRAAAELRDMAESEPERRRAAERRAQGWFKYSQLKARTDG
jgi:DNA primase